MNYFLKWKAKTTSGLNRAIFNIVDSNLDIRICDVATILSFIVVMPMPFTGKNFESRLWEKIDLENISGVFSNNKNRQSNHRLKKNCFIIIIVHS